jgi:hypothetical protein
MSSLSIGILMGIAGTAAMDIWALILRGMFNMPLPNWGNVGRWVAHLPRLFHDDIGQVQKVQNETAIGWVFHYAVGIVYGVFFVWVAGADWIAAPTFIPLWIFGLITISAGWFLLQPGMGLGWALSKTPNPTKGRVMGLIAHTVFSVGMWMPVVLLG